MPTEARVVSLKAKAKFSADLAFSDSGIIEKAASIIELGSPVRAYNPRSALYPRLHELDAMGRPVFDSAKLRDELLPKALLVLDNESQAAELDQAILVRQNEYLTLYRHIETLAEAVNKASVAKRDSLELLRNLVDDHHKGIEDAYAKEEQQSDPDNPKHDPAIRPTTINTVKLAAIRVVETGTSMQHEGKGIGGPVPWTHETDQTTTIVHKTAAGGWDEYTDPEPKLVSQQITSIVQSDNITFPRVENHMRHERLSADLSDEMLAELIFSKRLPYLKQIWQNEMDDIDLAVRKLQLAYISTFLFSSIDGKVTALAKQVGENTRPGELVVRVENENALLLLGQVFCPSAISVGQHVAVTSKHAFGDDASPNIAFNGKVAAIRGFEGSPGKWNVSFDVTNDGAVKIPIGYEFDPDPQYTTISLG